MRIIGTRVILMVQLAIGSHVHRPLLLLGPRVVALHLCVLLPLAIVLTEKDGVIQKSSTVHITLSFVVLVSHLDIIVLSNDYIAIHFLDDRLFDRRHLRGKFLFL